MNAIHWFEIAVTDLDRAARWYEELLAVKLKREEFFGTSLALFPYAQPGVGGCLMRADESRKPGAGTTIYLDCNGKLDACIARVQKLGGTLVMPRTEIGPAGVIAILRDLDGNVVGLHSEK